ncbi:hypothetical protein [Paludibacterium yongneupense]|uniref:hypothetical protein n=1 Tax=Paludibacterium yongneupense TaxID=400061 RepID=UPI0004100800|nr:hypothetical protein [Paludibacterium yongneupense]
MSDLSPALKPCPDRQPTFMLDASSDANRTLARRYKTLYGHETVTLCGRQGVGEPPIAAIFTTFVYTSGSDCTSDIACYSTVQLQVPNGNASHSGILSGPGEVSLSVNPASMLQFGSAPDLPAGLFLTRGSVSLPSAPTTPVTTQGSAEQLYLGNRGCLLALDLGSGLALTQGEPGHRQLQIKRNLRMRETAVFAPSFAPPRDDGISYQGDIVRVDGDATLDEGAVLKLAHSPHPLVFPATGLPVLQCKGTHAGRLVVQPQPQWYRTDWVGDTLHVFNRSQTLLSGRTSVPPTGHFGSAPVVADGAALIYPDSGQCEDAIEWIRAGSLNFGAVETEAVHSGDLSGEARLTVSTPPGKGQAILACNVDLPAGVLVTGAGSLLVCGDAARTPFTLYGPLICATRIASVRVETGKLGVSTGCHPAAQTLCILGDLDVSASGLLCLSLVLDSESQSVVAADHIAIGGDARFDRGASLALDNYMLGLPIPVDGLPLLTVSGHIHGPAPELIATIGLYLEWQASTLYLRQIGRGASGERHGG